MAVSTTNAVSGPYVANGSTTSFPFTFKALAASEMRVTITIADVETEVAPTEFIATINDGASGGMVVFTTAPASGDVRIYSDPVFIQEAAFASGQRFSPTAVNDALDRSVVRDQYLLRKVNAVADAQDAGIVGDVRSDLASTASGKGAGLVGFIQSGTDPLAKTVQSELRRTIDASQFVGFDPTGASDSTAAVQNALDLCSSLGGGSVTIPNGARVLICSSGSLTVPPQCHLVGPHVGGVDNGGTNLSFPWGAMGGTLISDAGPGRTILIKGSVSGLLMHRKGMTFPSTSSGSDYVGDAIHMAGDGATVQDCMILGFDRSIYSRNWQRIRIDNVKTDHKSCGADVRQVGDTGVIRDFAGHPYAGGGSNILTARPGSLVRFWGKCDWMQMEQCQEYGYALGLVDMRNELSDQGDLWGPANVRIINCRSDDGWTGTNPYNANKSAISVTGNATDGATPGTEKVRAFDVLIDNLQTSCAGVAGLYLNAALGSTDSGIYNGFHMANCGGWNGPGAGLFKVVSGDLTVTGGFLNGTAPGGAGAPGSNISPYAGVYSDSTGQSRVHVGGGFRVRGIATAHFLLDYSTPNFGIGHIMADLTKPMFSYAASQSKQVNAVAGAASVTLTAQASSACIGPEVIAVSGSGFNMASLLGGYAGRSVTLTFSGAATITSSTVDVNSMRLASSANFSTASGSTLTLVHTGALWFETGRSA